MTHWRSRPLCAPASALSTDREEPIEIEADSAEADDLKGITIYRGDVIITQGTLRITGSQVTIHYSKGNDFEKMITLGKKSGLHSYRQALSYITDKKVTERLFAELAPRPETDRLTHKFALLKLHTCLAAMLAK